ncbi:MAG: basal-body rod modification protein FlgD [bacterium]|nr:MAG: basal-body rod modification protein FlgD [bacterium]
MIVGTDYNSGLLESGAAGVGTGSNAMGKEEFLTLLLAQLKNQDPLSPMENTEFTAQMAQFSSLEQLFNVNDNLMDLRQINTSLNNTQALTLIGREVEVAGNSVRITDGVASSISFSLADDAANVSIRITNEAGEAVRTIEQGSAESGPHRIEWDGLSSDGGVLPDGVYSYAIDAVDASGGSINAQTYMTGVVDAISIEDGIIYVHIGDIRVTVSEITRVSQTDGQTTQTN